MKINLSTKPSDILKTMRNELPSVQYHYKKTFGGKNKYLDYEGKLIDTALKEEQSQTTGLCEYISKNGNRWVTYTRVEYYPNAKYAQAFMFSFIYYETYGSCGAFFPTYSANRTNKKGRPIGIDIFTSHFFLRFAERTGKEYRSKELIQEFISTKTTNAAQVDEEKDAIVKFKGGYGFGKEISKSPMCLEVRTYLTEEQMSFKQKKKCKKLDAFSSLVSDGKLIKDVALNTVLNNCESYEKAVEEGIKAQKTIKALNLEKQANFLQQIAAFFLRMITESFHMNLTTQQCAFVSYHIGENSMKLLRKWDSLDSITTKEQEDEFLRDLISIYDKTAKKLKLKSITKEKITEFIEDLMLKSANKEDTITN